MENEEKKAGFNQGERVVIAAILVALVAIIGIPLYRGIAVDDNVTAIMIFAIISGLIGFIIWHVSNNRTKRDRIQAQADLMNRMMEKFDSPEAFISFLDSPA